MAEHTHQISVHIAVAHGTPQGFVPPGHYPADQQLWGESVPEVDRGEAS